MRGIRQFVAHLVRELVAVYYGTVVCAGGVSSSLAETMVLW